MTSVSVYILGDQLLKAHPALQKAAQSAERDSIRVVMVQSHARTARMPYHRKKLALLFSAMQHYAQWLGDEGYTVDYIHAKQSLDGLRQHIRAHQPDQLIMMAASEYRGRLWQSTLGEKLGITIEVLPNTQFLISQYNPYPEPEPDKRYVMEYFYREMRRHFDILMDGDTPQDGAWNFDKDNRKPLPKNHVPPTVRGFAPDALTQQVLAQVEKIEGAVGQLDGFDLAVTHAQADTALAQFIAERLENFGAYEDAMSAEHGKLYHSILSPYLNIGLLTPLQCIAAALEAYERGDAPINSVEGFVRQILGWREFMYWQYWRLMPDIAQQNAWGATNPLPDFFWTGDTDMNCLRHVIERAKSDGYAHHIERLMLISNFAVLAGLQPMQVNDWFLGLFIDAYEWVMIPNVIGMGLNADGGIIATKPYIASANYINKMSDYCTGCVFNHKKRTGDDACPFNYLYWNFLITHEERLRANPRLGKNVLGLRHLDDDEREWVQAGARAFLNETFNYRSH